MMKLLVKHPSGKMVCLPSVVSVVVRRPALKVTDEGLPARGQEVFVGFEQSPMKKIQDQDWKEIHLVKEDGE